MEAGGLKDDYHARTHAYSARTPRARTFGPETEGTGRPLPEFLGAHLLPVDQQPRGVACDLICGAHKDTEQLSQLQRTQGSDLTGPEHADCAECWLAVCLAEINC
jgi:hypothetical protein